MEKFWQVFGACEVYSSTVMAPRDVSSTTLVDMADDVMGGSGGGGDSKAQRQTLNDGERM